MMAGGIVLTAFAPIGLLVGAAGALSGQGNVFAGGFGAAIVFAGVGVPLMVIGARREPDPTAQFIPWVAPKAAGLGFVLKL
jgi:hypothetical protein